MEELEALKTPSDVERRFTTEIQCQEFLLGVGVLKSDVICLKCNEFMCVRRKGSRLEFRCRKNGVDCSSRGIQASSFFRGSKIKMTVNMKMLVTWIGRYTNAQMSQLCAVSGKTIVDYKNFYRGLCSMMVRDFPAIGGPGHTVEADETAFHSRKYGRGEQKSPTVWVFGAIDRDTQKGFAVIVERRDKETLKRILLEKVIPGSRLYTDSWKGYCGISKHYDHYTLNHSKQFKRTMADADGNQIEVCTNLIENMWMRLKKPLAHGSGTTDEMLQGYLDEFIARQHLGDKFAARVWEELVKFRE